LDGPDFGIRGLACCRGHKSSGDDHAAKLGEHVGERRVGLAGVPGPGGTVFGGVVRLWPCSVYQMAVIE